MLLFKIASVLLATPRVKTTLVFFLLCFSIGSIAVGDTNHELRKSRRNIMTIQRYTLLTRPD